jgi:phosphatidylethanolamine-binding protein (PEBP) family uncharacterized protein
MLQSLLLTSFVLLLTGCSALNPWSEDKAQEAPSMSIEVDLQARHRCSRISPEIQIRNAPANTKQFAVRLEEQAEQPRYLGGGHWKNDATGIIPEGALVEHYQGACPPAGTSGKYTYTVTALGEGEQPLEVRIFSFTQE